MNEPTAHFLRGLVNFEEAISLVFDETYFGSFFVAAVLCVAHFMACVIKS